MTQIKEVKFEKQLLNACWKQKSKVKIKESKLLYQPKWTLMIGRFGHLPFFVLAVSIDKQLFYEDEFKGALMQIWKSLHMFVFI